MSFAGIKLSNYVGQDGIDELKDYFTSVDKDLDTIFKVASIFYQFGTGSNYSILTYTSSNYQWYPTIGAWSITNSLLYGGAGASYIGLQPGVGVWMGDPAFGSAVFSVDPTGQMIAHAGRIGGWYIGLNTLSSTNLVFDSLNERIGTSNYVSGALGSGWRIDNNLAEFQNIRARGKITTAVFEKDVISSIGGSLLVLDSDILSVDMTSTTASNLAISGDTIFTTNDVLRIKDGVDDEWFQVTGSVSAFTYIVSRDKASAYGAAKPVWKKGTAVVNYRQSGQGGILLTSSEANAPYIDFFTHSASPWSTMFTKTRLGNLTGIAGASGYGIWAGSGYLAQLQIIDLITMGASGSIRSNIAGNYPYLEFSNNGLQLKDSDTGGTYGTGVYGTAKYGYGALVWLMNSSFKIPWVELKEPADASGKVASLRLYNRGNTPTGLAVVGDLAVASGKLYICTTAGSSPASVWTVVGNQT